MSHTSTIKTEYTDADVLQESCKQLGWTWLGRAKHELYSSSDIGLGIQIPGWSYPVIVTDAGQLRYDDYNGRWGDVKQLDELKQRYAVEKTRAACLAKGHKVFEKKLDNGHIQLQIHG